MDTQLLKAFVVVAETRSFSLAAQKLHLTQPAVSKRIALLEDQLDCVLLDRLGRQCLLTEAGMTLFPRARQVLETLEDSRRAIENLRDAVGGHLSLGTSHHIGLHRLPPILKSFTALYPEVKLDMHFSGSEEVCQQVADGKIELGVVTLPLEPSAQLSTIPLWNDPLIFVASRNARLPAKPHASDLANIPAILPERGTYTRQIVEDIMRKKGITINEGLSTNYLETIKMMVSVGLGWSVLPESMVSTELDKIEVEGLKLQRTLGVVYHHKRTLSNAANAMLSVLAQKNKPHHA